MGLFPVGTVLVPGELLPLHIFEERYKDLIGQCLERDAPFVLLYADDDGGARDVGCTARVVDVVERFDDGRMNILVRGEEVVTVLDLTAGRSYLTGHVAPAPEDLDPGGEAPATRELFRRAVTASGAPESMADEADDPLSYAIAARVEMPAAAKQRILELRSERERLAALADVLSQALRGLEEVEEIRRRASGNGEVERRPG